MKAPLLNEIAPSGVILIVDDVPSNLEVLFDVLSDSGFRILVAEDGESAIQRARYALPDLILMDVLMPGIDGFETCCRLKQDELTANIPVIFMTALAETVDKVKGFNCGAVDYITKPFQQEEVLVRVTTHVRIQQLTRQIQAQMAREKIAQAERQAARDRARAILESITDAFFALDQDWRFIYVNHQAEKFLHRKREDLLGKILGDEFPMDADSPFWQGYQKAVTEQVSVEFEAFYEPLQTWFEVHAYPAQEGLSVYFQNINDRKRTNEALRESEERFHQAFENAAIGMALVSLKGEWIQVNHALCEMLGYTKQELLASNFQSITHPDDLEQGLNSLLQLVTGRVDTFQLEKRYIHKSGRIVWVALSSSMIRNQAGKALYMVSQIEDITDRKQAAEELQNLSKALESAVEGISQLDIEGRYVHANPAYASMIGYTPEEMIGMAWQRTVHPDDLALVEKAYQRMLTDGKSETEARAIRKDGSFFDKQIVLVKAYDQRYRFSGNYCFVKDISDRREIERLKDEFVSLVSHELRTPLTSISGALDLLANGVLQSQPEDAQRMLNIAASSTDRLVRLINDILDIERIESGKIAMTKQVCDAAELITDSTEAMQDMAERAGITFVVSPLSLPVWADPDRIIQVLTNLLSNAIKFSQPGNAVWVSVERMEKANGRGQKAEGRSQKPGARRRESEIISQLSILNSKLKTQNSQFSTQNSQLKTPPYLLFKVKDEGRGIPADKLETVFGRFQQVDASDSRQKGGTGLGLAICRTILQHHGGQIWVESELGKGSTFYFTLPMLDTPLEPQSTDPLLEVKGRKSSDVVETAYSPLVLVCDDAAAVRGVVQTALERQNFRVMAVASGQEAIALSSRQPPDVVLLNLMMPEMDGWETLARLKQQPSTQNIPVIILSGLLPDARKAPPANVSDWIVKPPNQRLLFQALERALVKQHPVIRALVVEDDLDLAQVLLEVFSRHGIQAFHASTGYEAIQLSQQFLPDLLVLDLGLPEQDGFAVVDWLKHHTQLCRVPLVVYTARDLSQTDRDRLKLGHTVILTKGRITPQEFERQVVDLLNRITRDQKGERLSGC